MSCFPIFIVVQQKLIFLKKDTAQHRIISFSLFFRETDESQNMRIFASFIACHAVAPFRAVQPKSSAGAPAIFQAGRSFALARSSSNRLSGAGAFMTSNDAKSSRLSPIHDSLVVQGLVHVGSKHRLCISQPWLGSAPIPLRREIDYLGGECYNKNHPSPFSSRYLPNNCSNTACDCMERKERITHLYTGQKLGRCHPLELNDVDPSHRCSLGSPNF